MNYIIKNNINIACNSLLFWFSVYIFLPILPLFYHDIGFQNSSIGLFIGIFSVGSIIFRPIVGKLSDTWGHYTVLYFGIIVSFLSVCCYFITSNVWVIIITRLLHGIGSACCSTSAATLITLKNEKKDIKGAMSLYSTFTMLGISIATALAYPIFNYMGIEIIVGISLLSIGIGYLMVCKQQAINIDISTRVNTKNDSLRSIFFHKNVCTPTINQFTVYLCYGAIITFLPLMAIMYKLTNLLWIFYLIYAIAVIISRISAPRFFYIFSDNTLMILILINLAIVMLITMFFSSIFIMIIIAILLGVSVGLATPTFATMVANNTASHVRGLAIGIFGTFMDIGLAMGSIVGGFLIKMITYQQVFLLLFVTVLLTILFNVLYKNSDNN